MGRFPRRGRCCCIPGTHRRGDNWACLQNGDQFAEMVHPDRIRTAKVARVQRDSGRRLGEAYIGGDRHRYRCHCPESVDPGVNIRDGNLRSGLLRWVRRCGALQAQIVLGLQSVGSHNNGLYYDTDIDV